MGIARALATLLSIATFVAAADPLSQANEAFRSGDYAKAVELFQVAAELEPKPDARAEIWVKLAWTQFALRQRNKAESALQSALADQPNLELVPDYYSDEFLALFSRVKAKLGAAATAPSPPPVVTADALAKLRSRADEAADPAALELLLHEIQQMENGVPSTALPQVLDIRAAVFERLGRNEQALEDLGRAAALRAGGLASPGSSGIPYDTLLEGRRLTANGQPLDSAALMRGVLAAQPSCGPALEVLGEAYLAAGRYDESHAALRAAILAGPRPDLFLTLGEVDIRRANPAGAREAFRRATELDPNNERALAALGLLAAGSGDPTTARHALDAALSLNGTLFEARVARGQLAFADGELNTAVRHFQSALQVHPGDAWARGWLGLALLAQGDAATAAELLNEADERVSVFPVARAEALRRIGRPRDALESLAVVPSSAEAALVAARCNLDENKPAEALASLEPAATLHPGDGRIRYLLSVVRAAQGDRRGALDELEAAMELPGVPLSASQSAASLAADLAAEELMRSAQVPLRQPPQP